YLYIREAVEIGIIKHIDIIFIKISSKKRRKMEMEEEKKKKKRRRRRVRVFMINLMLMEVFWLEVFFQKNFDFTFVLFSPPICQIE
ncbi:MAG TPA: hypothetical protein PLK63_15020, partial [Catalimonadaceae bacterium]|nr:hypothetical protein [Catalimonadaceae bacterium]